MNLRHIKSTACPQCGETEIVQESRELESQWSLTSPRRVRQHCCGEQWETREFLCGYVVKWIPNFSREEQNRVCRRNAEYVALLERVETLKKLRTALDEKIRAAEHAVYQMDKGVA